MNYREKAKKRLIETFQDLDEQAQADVLEEIQFGNALKAAREAKKTKTVTFGDLYETAQGAQATMNSFDGFGSGLSYFDAAIMGFRPGEVVLIAGPPNFGKTMVSLNLITNTVANSLRKGVIISLEMTAQEIANRVYNIADTSDHEYIKENLRIQTDLKVGASGIEHIIKRDQPDIVMIDLLQKLADREKGTEYERVSAAMAKVKDIALRTMTPIILISHVAKTRSGKNGEATAADLKGASNIEQDIDVGIMINKVERDSFDIVCTNFKHRTKRPKLYNKNCVIKSNGIKILEDGVFSDMHP